MTKTKAAHLVRPVGRPKKPKVEKLPKEPRKSTKPEVYATALTGGRWAIRPVGQLGTWGLFPKSWDMIVVKAETPEQAIAKAKGLGGIFRDKSLN